MKLTVNDATKAELIEYFFKRHAPCNYEREFLFWLEQKRSGDMLEKLDKLAVEASDAYQEMIEWLKKCQGTNDSTAFRYCFKRAEAAKRKANNADRRYNELLNKLHEGDENG